MALKAHLLALVISRRYVWEQGMSTALHLGVKLPYLVSTCLSQGTGLQIWVQRHPSNPKDLSLGNLWLTTLI